jgi:predicted dinucleotide-binding enzyme
MKIGIIGSAEVGQTLGNAFLSEGNQVMLGSRDPSKKELVKWKKENPGGETGALTETAQFGEILVLCTAGSGAENAIRLAGVDHFAGKVVIDTTNPISDTPPTNGVLHCFTTLEDSLLERLQRLIPAAKFVKAFNSAGSDYMYKPQFPGGVPTMFICGNDEGARAIVSGILEQFGWEVADMGKAEAARAIEPLCVLWCIPGLARNEWTHAFKLLKA